MRNHKCKMASAAFVALTGAVMLCAQQHDDGPGIVRPKTKVLVTCDLPCDWKLDGEAQSRIPAGGSAAVPVNLGQHIVVAASADGLDRDEKDVNVQKSGVQVAVRIELLPLRQARLKTEQDARDRAAAAAAATQQREEQARNQAAQNKRGARLAKEESEQTWTDPATGLMWTNEDSGVGLTWAEAASYCSDLELAGYKNWRMATIDELASIVGEARLVRRSRPRGKIALSDLGDVWSSNPAPNAPNGARVAWIMRFEEGGRRDGVVITLSNGLNALCVRRSGR